MNELDLTRTFLVTKLKANAALTALIGGAVSPRIYAGMAPSNAAYPFVVFGLQAGRDRNAIGPDARIFTLPLYRVLAVSKGVASYAEVGAIATQIDVALQGANNNGQVAALYVQGTRREEVLEFIEVVDSVQYRYQGALWRLFIHD